MKKTLFAPIGALALLAIIASPFLVSANDSAKHSSTTPSMTSPRPALEVVLSDNGKALVRGAKVTNVSGNTVTAQTSWGSSQINWTVKADSTTSFIRTNTSTSTIANVGVGDIVSFSGTINISAPAFTVNANALKDWTLIGTNPKPVDHDKDATSTDDKDGNHTGFFNGWGGFFAKFNFFGKQDTSNK